MVVVAVDISAVCARARCLFRRTFNPPRSHIACIGNAITNNPPRAQLPTTSLSDSPNAFVHCTLSVEMMSGAMGYKWNMILVKRKSTRKARSCRYISGMAEIYQPDSYSDGGMTMGGGHADRDCYSDVHYDVAYIRCSRSWYELTNRMFPSSPSTWMDISVRGSLSHLLFPRRCWRCCS
jgi:hypothetical protein